MEKLHAIKFSCLFIFIFFLGNNLTSQSSSGMSFFCSPDDDYIFDAISSNGDLLMYGQQKESGSVIIKPLLLKYLDEQDTIMDLSGFLPKKVSALRGAFERGGDIVFISQNTESNKIFFSKADIPNSSFLGFLDSISFDSLPLVNVSNWTLNGEVLYLSGVVNESKISSLFDVFIITYNFKTKEEDIKVFKDPHYQFIYDIQIDSNDIWLLGNGMNGNGLAQLQLVKLDEQLTITHLFHFPKFITKNSLFLDFAKDTFSVYSNKLGIGNNNQNDRIYLGRFEVGQDTLSLVDSTLLGSKIVMNHTGHRGAIQNQGYVYAVGSEHQVGGSFSFDNFQNEIMVAKLDEKHNRRWAKTFSIENKFLHLSICKPRSKFIYLIGTMFEYLNSTEQQRDIFLMKLNQDGELITGLNNFIRKENEHFAYPNPTLGHLHFEVPSEQHSFVKVFDLQGKMLLRESLVKNGNVDVSELPPGIYLYKVEDGNENVMTGKFVKE